MFISLFIVLDEVERKIHTEKGHTVRAARAAHAFVLSGFEKRDNLRTKQDHGQMQKVIIVVISGFLLS